MDKEAWILRNQNQIDLFGLFNLKLLLGKPIAIYLTDYLLPLSLTPQEHELEDEDVVQIVKKIWYLYTWKKVRIFFWILSLSFCTPFCVLLCQIKQTGSSLFGLSCWIILSFTNDECFVGTLPYKKTTDMVLPRYRSCFYVCNLFNFEFKSWNL